MSINELFNKANKLFRTQNYFEGLKIYKQIWIEYPKNTRLYEEINKKIKRYNKPISQTYRESDVENFFKKAKQFYNDALNQNPNDKMTLNNLAALSFYKGEQLIAEKLYSEAIKKSENNYEAIYHLGLCQLAQLKFSDGWKNYKFRWLGNQLGSKKLFVNLPQFALNTNKRNLLVWDE